MYVYHRVLFPTVLETARITTARLLRFGAQQPADGCRCLRGSMAGVVESLKMRSSGSAAEEEAVLCVPHEGLLKPFLGLPTEGQGRAGRP